MSVATATAHCMQTAVLCRSNGSNMLKLLQVWCTAIPLYAVMPAAIEWAAEQGWTRAYSRFVVSRLVMSVLGGSMRGRGSGCTASGHLTNTEVAHTLHVCVHSPARVADVGIGWHILYFAAFMTSVEAGVYVMHRSLHDVRLYRCVSSFCTQRARVRLQAFC